MADDNKDDSMKQDVEVAKNVCTMNVAQILTALHQNALANTNAASKGYIIANSAISEDGEKVESAGEHIISLIREDPSKGDPVKKADAVSMLQTYVQWFVGPDLAKKVNDSTVLPLDSAPSEGKKENEGKNEDKLSESKFIPFGKWLVLNEDQNNSTADDVSFDDDGNSGKDEDQNNSTADDVSFDDDNGSEDNKEKNKDKDALDPKVESKEGYYITYGLKVEGLPQKALKDAMKKFATTFFDDVKIYGSGLFGGSYSFTVGDIKKSLRDAFGPIDPDQLVSSVEDKISKLYKGSGHPEVKVQDKTTLISDLGKQINGQQKKQIDSADYSLFIKVDEDDPKKPIFNPRIIADIVTSSIKSLFKKFKNTITKNDVILIHDYQDTHKSSQAVRELYSKVPTSDQIYAAINKANNANDAYDKIERMMDKINRDKQRKNCDRALKCSTLWEKFRKDHEKNSPKERATLTGNDKLAYFKDFINQYEKTFKETKDKSIESTLNESLTLERIRRMTLHHIMKSLLLEEEDSSDRKESIKVSSKQIKDTIMQFAKALGDIDMQNNAIIVDSKELIKGKLKFFDISSYDDAFGEFKNGVLICKEPNMLAESSLYEDIKQSIMHILFNEADNDTDTSNNNTISEDLIYKILKVSFKDLKIDDFASNLLVFSRKKLDESSTSSTQIDKEHAYVLPFGKTDVEVTSDDNINDNKDDNAYGQQENKDDLYIVPMPGLAHEDPEYANTNM